jgi:hypothetical protein
MAQDTDLVVAATQGLPSLRSMAPLALLRLAVAHPAMPQPG